MPRTATDRIVKGQGFISPVDTGCQQAHILSQSDSVVAEFYIEMLQEVTTLRRVGPDWWGSLTQAQLSALFPANPVACTVYFGGPG